MYIDRTSLTQPDALKAANVLLAGKKLPADLVGAAGEAKVVMDAVRAGWFIIPAGRNGSYTKRQFERFSQHLAFHPGIADAVADATQFVARLPELWTGLTFELFGRPSSKRFTDPLVAARMLASSCPRMPYDFKAGENSADVYCNLLDDVSNNCRRLHDYVRVLGMPGMLDPESALSDKVSTLRQSGNISLLPALIHSVHRIYMGREGEQALRKVIYEGRSIEGFLHTIEARNEQNRQQSEATWKTTFRVVSAVAHVLADASSYHQASLTKELRRHLGKRFGLARVVTPTTNKLVVEVGGQLRLGESSNNRTEFELVNWMISLDEHLKGEENSIYGYLRAASSADEAVVRMRQDLNAA